MGVIPYIVVMILIGLAILSLLNGNFVGLLVFAGLAALLYMWMKRK